MINDPEQRFGIDEILESEWMDVDRKLLEEWKNSFSIGNLTTEKIIKIIKEFGFSENIISNSLDKHVLNHIYCCYHLLKGY